MQAIEPLDDEDFSDLDSIIAEAEEESAAKRALATKRKRLSAGRLSDDDRMRLLAEVRAAEDLYVWRTVAGVALFHSQHCLSCGHRHRFFMGWMTLQQHKHDPNCRRYIRGRPADCADSHIEDHAQSDVELCADCAESCLAIESAISAAAASLSRQALEPNRKDPHEATQVNRPPQINPQPSIPLPTEPFDGPSSDICASPPGDDSAGQCHSA